MADIPDFRVQTPAVDPRAFADVLQRKQNAEDANMRAEEERKNSRLQRILSAITGGQLIATNMLNAADKREDINKKRAEAEAEAKKTQSISAIQRISQEQLPLGEPALSPEENAATLANAQKNRQARLEAAIAGAQPKEYAKAKLDALMGNPDKQFAPQQASIELKNGKITPAAFVNGKYYYPNTNDLIPPDEIAGRGYGLVPMTNADGSVSYVSRATARKLGTQSTAPDKTDIVDHKPLKTGINQLQTSEVGRLDKLKEDFNTDPTVKTALSKQGDYQMADSVVGIGNWVGDAAVLSVAAKGLGRDVGNLSTEEQRRYRMSPAVWESIKTKANLWAKGTIRPEDREVFKEAIRVMAEKNDDILNKKIDTYGRVASNRVKDLDPEFAKKYIYEKANVANSKPIEQMTLEELNAEEKRLLGKN